MDFFYDFFKLISEFFYIFFKKIFMAPEQIDEAYPNPSKVKNKLSVE